MQNHVKALAGRTGVAGTLCPDQQRRERDIGIGRRQNQLPLPRQTAPARYLVRIEIVVLRNPGHRRAGLQRLRDDPPLQLIGPATTALHCRKHFDLTEKLCRGLH